MHYNVHAMLKRMLQQSNQLVGLLMTATPRFI
jgi:hypothetical protein